MLFIYISKSPFALEIKLEDFLINFQREKILHLKRVDFETVKNQLIQVNLFEEYSHFIFEEYTGNFIELSNLFEQVSITSNILITKSFNNKSYLPQKLIDKLEDKNYWLFEPNYKSKEKYYLRLLDKFELKRLPNNFLEIIKKEAIYSNIQLKGVLTQLKLIVDSKKKLTEQLIRSLIESNNVLPQLRDKYLFLEWYLSGKIKNWVLFLKSLKIKKGNLEDVVFEFLKHFTHSLNFHFWNDENNWETQKFIRELSYNFLIFIENAKFKIRPNLTTGLVYFFWKNRPLNKLKIVS